MAYKLSIPFRIFKLHFSGGGTVLAPQEDAHLLSANETSLELARRFEKQFQKMVIDKGELQELSPFFAEGNYEKKKVQLVLPPNSDYKLYPALAIEIEYIFLENEAGFIAFIPSLGLEAYAANAENLDLKVQEVVKMEFKRNQRLSNVYRLMEGLWYDKVELVSHEVSFDVPRLGEKNDRKNGGETVWLERVAQKIEVKNKEMYGRKDLLKQIKTSINNTFNQNILLVGPSGVGKTALVRELCYQCQKEQVALTIWETTASVIIKELMSDTTWQDNLPSLCKELNESGDFLFVDNLLQLFEIGQYEGNDVSVGAYLKSFLEKGTIKMISECTEEEKAKIELLEPNYLRSFQIISVGEPGEKELEEIVLKKINTKAKIKNVVISREAIQESIRLFRRFNPYSGFPGKAIRFLESLLLNIFEKEALIDRGEVIKRFCEESGMPPYLIDPSQTLDLPMMNAFFYQKIFGQDHAVEGLINVLISVKTAMTRKGKPIASFLFVGPTGVGKTEVSKVLAEFVFSARDRMLRFDMSEFSSPDTVMRLIGSHYYSDGLLTSAVRKEPFSVLLFDEIEKADPTFFDLLLQVLSEGRLTDSQGQLVNFCSSIIVMTSNIGASNLSNKKVGWKKKIDLEEVNHYFTGAVQQFFRPELYNRIDQIIPFSPLSRESVRFIVEREVELFRQREGVRFRNMDLTISEAVFDYLAEEGYDVQYGARQLKRIIQDLLIVPLSKKLNVMDFYDQLNVEIHCGQDGLEIRLEEDADSIEMYLEQLEKVNYADLASELRRKATRMRNSSYFSQIINKIDILEREKGQLDGAFWENKEHAEEYTRFLVARQAFEVVETKIIDLENQLALASAGFIPYDQQLSEALETWKTDFFELQVDILNELGEKKNPYVLGVYGRNLAPLYDFYQNLLKAKQIEYHVELIWYSNPPKKEMRNDAFLNYHTMKDLNCSFSKTIDFREPKIESEESPYGNLCGIEFYIEGSWAYYYLEPERGSQKWELDSKNSHYYFVEAYTKGEKRFSSDEMEVVDWFRFLEERYQFPNLSSTRRVVTETTLHDDELLIKRELPIKNHLELIISKLDQLFQNYIEQHWL